MKIFWRLYGYEWKKLWQNRLTKITISILLPICLFAVAFGGISLNLSDRSGITKSRYFYLFHLQEESKALSGSVLDSQLLSDMQQAFQTWRKDPNDETREQFQKYRLVYNYMFSIFPKVDRSMRITENQVYQFRTAALKSLWRTQQLTEGEIAYWLEQENMIQKPFSFGYAIGWGLIVNQMSIINITVLFVIIICLSGVFSREKIDGTDQLIYSSKLGRKRLYSIKIFTGISFSVAISLSFYLLSVLSLLMLYGAAGFNLPIQLIDPYCSWPVSVGGAVFIYFLLYFMASILYAIVTMFLSLLFQSRAATIVFWIGYISLINHMDSMTDIILEQFFYMDPLFLFMSWNIRYDKLIHLFGKYFTIFQFAPIIWLIILFLLLFAGRFLYPRRQIRK